MPTLSGTLLTPSGAPLANAKIILTAQRNEGSNILRGVSSEFSTNASGEYSQSVEPGLYSVKLNHQQQFRDIGVVFIDVDTDSSIEVLLAAGDDAEFVSIVALQNFLSDAQGAQLSAEQSADDAVNALAANQAQLDALVSEAQADVDAAIQSANNAAGEVGDLSGQLLAVVEQNSDKVDDFISGFQRFNLLSGSRGVDSRDQIIGVFEGAPEFFNAFNGGEWFEGDKYFNNSLSFGGNQPELSQGVLDLLAATGRSGGGLRYGLEFFTFRYVAGMQTISESSVYPGHYLCWVNDGRQIPEFSTFFMWVRVVSGSMSNVRGGFINGLFVDKPLIAPADGWVYTSIEVVTSRGYVTTAPSWYASPGAEIEIAMPAHISGRSDGQQFIVPIIEV